jgi:HNH endonuclease
MSGHAGSTAASRDLCDSVISKVEAEIGDAANKQAPTVCSVGKNGKFAFIYHHRDRLKIYLRCGEADGDLLASLISDRGEVKLSRRNNLGSSRAQLTPYYVELNSNSGVIEAVPLLLHAARTMSRLAAQRASGLYSLPSEEDAPGGLEGGSTSVYVNRFERDSKARRICIQIFGAACAVCGFDFGSTYGEIGAGFIHVHHLTPLSTVREKHKVNPRRDLRPVCPNCHEMLHRRTPPYSIEELKVRISKSSVPFG